MKRWPQPRPLEKIIQQQVTRFWRSFGCHVSSTSQLRPSMQAIGMADVWVVHPGWKVFFWAEIKRPGEQPTPAQRQWHEINRAAGVPVFVVTCEADAADALMAAGAPVDVRPVLH